jgi:hypothetical protein
MLVGAVLAVVVTLHGPLRSRAARGAVSAASAVSFVLVVLPWFASNATQVHDFFYGRFGLLAYSCASALVIWRLAQPSPGVLGSGLRLAPMVWVGAISYEMYLWHWPLYLVITPGRTGLSGAPLLFVRLASVVVVAAVTHFFVGEPIRRGVRLRSPNLARVATFATVVVVGVGVFAATVSARPMLSGDFGEVGDRSAPPALAVQQHEVSTAGPRATTLDRPIKVMVVGDSQGVTLAQGFDADPGVTGLSAQPGLAVWDRAILGCAVSSNPWFVIQGDRAPNMCGGRGRWKQQWVQDVAAFVPDVVVVQAGAWDVYDAVTHADAVVQPGDPAWKSAYTRDVAKLFDVLDSHGASIVAVSPPCYGGTSVTAGGASPAERLDARRVGAVHTAWQRAARSRGFKLLDLDRTLCPGGTSNASIRPDGAHYSNDGANFVSKMVANAVRDAVARRALAGR